jgi:hypothetical protein
MSTVAGQAILAGWDKDNPTGGTHSVDRSFVSAIIEAVEAETCPESRDAVFEALQRFGKRCDTSLGLTVMVHKLLNMIAEEAAGYARPR